MTFQRMIFLIAGILNVVLGALGILLPLLPTTPFLLLACYFFARSHDGWHRWLLEHSWFGPYIHAFRSRSGLTLIQKVRIAASFSVMLAISAYFAPVTAVRLMLAGLWLFWMGYLIRSRTAPQLTES
ncbi:MAG: YbaN family protein [Phycisphaerae bacterium]